ncbi:MAG: nucleotidyltransferase family protein [Nanoarchaeota archaeon]|nr:nucleotidyltransferase family protein [Nanoarchaeota archaeon]MBU1622168.1 nucleotidyltransferase family protein [Nanoarchaeota archaeon]MBU1974683.1 nucleotidyltransferase family protein [Nanoarchaeota archaeon]
MIKSKELRQIAKIVVPILKKQGIKKAGIFGSYARGDQKKKSDIDILIQPTRNMGLEFVGVKLELEEKLGKKVDLVTYKYIHPLIKDDVLNEEVRII